MTHRASTALEYSTVAADHEDGCRSPPKKKVRASLNGKTLASELREASDVAWPVPVSVAYKVPLAHRPQAAPHAPTDSRLASAKDHPRFSALIFCYMSNDSPYDHPAATRITTQPPGFVKHVKNIGRAYRKQATVLVACYRERIPASGGCERRSAELRK
jgi:hypothetical protein